MGVTTGYVVGGADDESSSTSPWFCQGEERWMLEYDGVICCSVVCVTESSIWNYDYYNSWVQNERLVCH